MDYHPEVFLIDELKKKNAEKLWLAVAHGG
jgi:hypothetical protein